MSKGFSNVRNETSTGKSIKFEKGVQYENSTDNTNGSKIISTTHKKSNTNSVNNKNFTEADFDEKKNYKNLNKLLENKEKQSKDNRKTRNDYLLNESNKQTNERNETPELKGQKVENNIRRLMNKSGNKSEDNHLKQIKTKLVSSRKNSKNGSRSNSYIRENKVENSNFKELFNSGKGFVIGSGGAIGGGITNSESERLQKIKGVHLFNHNNNKYNEDFTNRLNKKRKDEGSCNLCEEIYRETIINNKQINLKKCGNCLNEINLKSLEFFMDKYHNELIAEQKKRLEKLLDKNQFENLKELTLKKNTWIESEKEKNDKIIKERMKAKEAKQLKNSQNSRDLVTKVNIEL